MKPTFPIAEQELKKKGLKTIFGSVLTWAATLPTFGAWSIMEAPPYLYVPLGIATVIGLWFYWSKKLKKQHPQWIEDEVRASNLEQDAIIQHQVLQFQNQDAKWEAKQLQQALQYKQAIESTLLTKKPHLAVWARIETLIDTLIFSLIAKLETYQKSHDAPIKEKVQEALYQLQETNTNLAEIIAPHSGIEHNTLPKEDKLEAALRELKEEREIAKKVKLRLEQGYSKTTYSPQSGIVE